MSDYIVQCKQMGEAAFEAHYGRLPVLIGVGLVGVLEDQGYGAGGQTIGVLPAITPEMIQAASLVGRVWSITKTQGVSSNPNILLGRGYENDIVIPEYSLSRRHCYFVYHADGIYIKDLGSFNGTQVGDKKLARNQEQRLKDGDRVILGRFCFEFLK